MNNRIKQISRDVWGWSEDQTYSNSDEFSDIWEAEFAKRILQEALEQVDKLIDSLDNDGDNIEAIGASWAALAIAKHFGLE